MSLEIVRDARGNVGRDLNLSDPSGNLLLDPTAACSLRPDFDSRGDGGVDVCD